MGHHIPGKPTICLDLIAVQVAVLMGGGIGIFRFRVIKDDDTFFALRYSVLFRESRSLPSQGRRLFR